METFFAEMYDTSDGGFLASAARAQPPSYFVFTLTRQHDPPPTERERSSPISDRDAWRFDGFEGCWFVWSIEPERRGGGGGGPPGSDDGPPPGLELSLPAQGRLR